MSQAVRVVIDVLSGREVHAGPEEVEATQPMLFYLTQRLGWHSGQIMTRPQWRVPRSPSAARQAGYPVDIAIFDSPEHLGDPDHVRIIIECKAPTEAEGITQLKTYLSLEPEARLGIWFNGEKHRLVYKLRDGFAVHDFAPIPRPTDPLTPSARNTPLRYADLTPPPKLREIFVRLRTYIAARDKHINRDEFILNDLANLLICKIADEQAGAVDPDRTMAFQRSATQDATAEAIRSFFGDVQRRFSSVFMDESERLQLDDASLDRVVEMLEPYRLLGHDRHAVGLAFEVLRSRALKGDEGAYFTPPPLVDCVVSILDPGPQSRIIDPACGTGGFLAAALDHVFAKIDERKISDEQRIRSKQAWAADCLFAVDKDAVSVRLAKAYLTLLGDGRAHAYRADSIDQHDWEERDDDIKRSVRPGTFDMVLTNPPFGSKLTVDGETGRREGLTSCRRWERDERGAWRPTSETAEQQLGVVFVERAMQLLKDGGRLAIVLPETFLFSETSLAWFTAWLARNYTITHVVDVPMVAFEEFCRAKTCLLFLTKTPPSPGHRVFMSYPRSIGQDKNGNMLRKIDPATGTRTGELDNEMAEAVRALAAIRYEGVARTAGVQESRLCFTVLQSEVLGKAVIVPRYWWRRETDAALGAWIVKHPATVRTLGDLEKTGVITGFAGHGSPAGNARGTGTVPYVKVTDLKNWRINENPTNLISDEQAKALQRGGMRLKYGDLISPARASSNIGQFSMVMPWQTNVVLTKEILGLRVNENADGIDAFLLLALLSLRVVQAQYAAFTLMQTNREHLGSRWREIQLPIPNTAEERERVAKPVRDFFDTQVKARESYTALLQVFDPNDFATRP